MARPVPSLRARSRDARELRLQRADQALRQEDDEHHQQATVDDVVPSHGTGAEPDAQNNWQHDTEDAPLDIGLLDLAVQFEIDSVALPLAQLAALRPGYVIELAAPVLDTPVRLVTHGQTVGYGEIVCVGEHLGVRITRMAYAGDSDR